MGPNNEVNTGHMGHDAALRPAGVASFSHGFGILFSFCRPVTLVFQSNFDDEKWKSGSTVPRRNVALQISGLCFCGMRLLRLAAESTYTWGLSLACQLPSSALNKFLGHFSRFQEHQLDDLPRIMSRSFRRFAALSALFFFLIQPVVSYKRDITAWTTTECGVSDVASITF